MKWPGTGFTVELPCGEWVYMGTLEEMAQREATGIYGPDPCAEVEEVAAPVPYVEDEVSSPGNGCGRTGCGGPGECICADLEAVAARTNGHVTLARSSSPLLPPLGSSGTSGGAM